MARNVRGVERLKAFASFLTGKPRPITLTSENLPAVEELIEAGELKLSDIEITNENLAICKALAKRIVRLKNRRDDSAAVARRSA